jgi:MinD-like ATPase involved in chromosome partitioning or flagellar assembly
MVTDRERGDGSDTFDPFAASPPPEPTPPPNLEPGPAPTPPNPAPAAPTPWDRAAHSAGAPSTPAGQPPATGRRPEPDPQDGSQPRPFRTPDGPVGGGGGGAHSDTGPQPTTPGPGDEPSADVTYPHDRRNAFGPPPMREDATVVWPTGSRPPPYQPGLMRPGARPYAPGAPPPTPPQWSGDQGRPSEQERPSERGRWEGGPPGAPQAPAGGPVDYNYTERIRSSELVRTRKIPPARGWRRAVLKITFGLINLGQSPDERRQADLEAKIRSLLRGRYKIGVLGKGGTGKTTLAASVGSLLAELRQEDRVVAIDADTAFGKLGSRVDPSVSGSYWELASDQHLHTFADVRSRVGNNTSGLFVLPGERSAARRRVLDPAIYREAAARLDNHFTISIVDCGSTMDSPVTQEALQDLDALIVVSSPWVDGASAAGQTMEWLANNGYTGLLHRTVVVLNDSDGHSDKRTRNVLLEQFGNHGQVVVEVPYDAHLRPGGVIDVDNEMHPLTRRKLTEIAAAIAEHFPATTDRPRERR